MPAPSPTPPFCAPHRRGATAAARPRASLRGALLPALAALAALAAACAPRPGTGVGAPGRQAPPPPEVQREFRGVWVATVANIDWPSRPGLSTAQQQAELLALLDRAQALNLNAIVFQVRPAADALYESAIEPWSEYLTGTMGKAPEPRWDPLAFAVAESHRRGMELHAWFNPYRARHAAAKTPAAPSHVSAARPELVRRYNKWQWMDPGEPGTPAYSLSVVLDVVRRYDVDGVHIDDYFYPYKENDPATNRTLDFPDSASYARYVAAGGTLGRDDWRRRNVDDFVQSLYTRVREVKPWVKVGISPFGIWRPGHPEKACCFDAYQQLYADARKWWRAGWVDYFTPQLYWAISAPQQSYPMLLRWWAEENVTGRALWPGNYTSRVGQARNGYTAAELDSQVVLTRDRSLPNGGAGGNVHFSMAALMKDAGGVGTLLQRGSYAEPALVPAMPWMPGRAPGLPIVALDGRGAVTLAPASGEGRPWQWAVRALVGSTWRVSVLPGSATAWRTPDGAPVSEALVFAVDRTGREGPTARVAARPLAAR
jgi:uncharacterized lipoprotein YddW (UPF0748 family)